MSNLLLNPYIEFPISFLSSSFHYFYFTDFGSGEIIHLIIFFLDHTNHSNLKSVCDNYDIWILWGVCYYCLGFFPS